MEPLSDSLFQRIFKVVCRGRFAPEDSTYKITSDEAGSKTNRGIKMGINIRLFYLLLVVYVMYVLSVKVAPINCTGHDSLRRIWATFAS